MSACENEASLLAPPVNKLPVHMLGVQAEDVKRNVLVEDQGILTTTSKRGITLPICFLSVSRPPGHLGQLNNLVFHMERHRPKKIKYILSITCTAMG